MRSVQQAGRRGLRPRSRTVLLLLCATWSVACGSGRRYIADPGPYDRVPPRWIPTLRQARSLLAEERPRDAHDVVFALVRENPALLPVRIFLQDLQLQLLERGELVGGFGLPRGADMAASLGDRYRQRADANPNPVEYVLAARLHSNAAGAIQLLSEAEALDPTCVWVYYAKAWWNAQRRQFPEARAAVLRAFELDGGHMPTMRLNATLQAGAGETEEAILSLEPWLERSAADPLIERTDRAEAQVDLASLLVLEGKASQALSRLDRVTAKDLLDPARAALVRAVALQAVGREREALAAAERAQRLDPTGLLARVHHAMLLASLGDQAGERLIWEDILEQAELNAEEARGAAGNIADVDFTSILIQVRAHTRLARMDAMDAALLEAAQETATDAEPDPAPDLAPDPANPVDPLPAARP